MSLVNPGSSTTVGRQCKHKDDVCFSVIHGWSGAGSGGRRALHNSSQQQQQHIQSSSSGCNSQMAFKLAHRRLLSTQYKPLNLLPVRPMPSAARAVHAAATKQRRGHAWQHALLEAMQEEYCKYAAESNPTLSCSTLEAYLDAVYDSLDEVFFSKVCVCLLTAPTAAPNCQQTGSPDADALLHLQGGFVIPKRERQLIDATGGSSSYGEIQASGVDQLLRWVVAADGWCVVCGMQADEVQSRSALTFCMQHACVLAAS